MTARFYISDFTGDGIAPETAFYPRILSMQSSPAIRTIDGRAIGNVNGPCLVYTDNTDAEHDTVIAHPNVRYVPFENTNGDVLTINDTAGDIATARRNAIISFLEARNIPTHGFTLQTTIREIVLTVIRRYLLQANLRELDLTEGLDTLIADIPAQRRQAIAAKLQTLGFNTSGLSGTVRKALKSLMDQDVRAMRVRL